MKYLFRGQRKDIKVWVYGMPVWSVNEKCYMIHGATEDAINTKNEVDFIFCEVTPETVTQYTGRKDSKGVKIFEGDIVKIILPNPKGWERIGIITFPKQYLMWAVSIPGTMGLYELRAAAKRILVIGNKFENPELLEEKQDD